MSDEILKSLRCDDCAFTPGTEANKSGNTQIKVYLCAQNAVPFYCHKREGLCAGWAEAVNVLDANDHFVRLAPWKREVMDGCLEVIDRAEERNARGEEVADQQIVQDIMNVMGNLRR